MATSDSRQIHGMNASLNTFCLVILAAIVVLVTLQQAQDILAPIVAAFLLGVVMTPLSDLWERLRLPVAIAAFLSVLLALATILLILLLLEPYISLAISQAPVIRDELRASIRELRALLSGLEQLSDDMVAAIEPNGSTGSTDGAAQLPSLTDALFYAPQFAAQFLIFTGTLYFFLLARNSVYDWLSRRIAPLQKSDLHLAAKQVARYVLTISAINLGFGTLVVVVMHVIGMPYPVIWGLLAFLLNFVLYLGPAALVAMLTITGMVVFDGAASFVPPALYLAMNATEAQFVTPTLVGKSLAVNPLLIFLSLIFWLWLWGPIGGIIAIPLLIWSWTVFRGFSDQAISGGTPGKS